MGKSRKQLKLKNIKITDPLFGAYVKKVSEKVIPHQWSILNDQLEDAEPTYCIQNFRIAAGEETGERRGVVFQDTDLYKWLETVAYCLAAGQGREYEKLADEAIDLAAKAQEADGYLNTYFTVNAPHRKWKNLVEGHELYTAGHMIEAAVAYYQATGKDKILQVAQKNADLICQIFGRGEGQIKGYPGHQEIELALVKLYRVTGVRTYLETARYFIEERGKEPNYFAAEIAKRGGYEFFPDLQKYDLEYSQSHMQPVRQTRAVGHAVRDMYMCSAMADLAEEYDDEEMLKACRSIWDNMTQRQMYITGGIGTSGFRERFTTDYDLPNNTNYSETCASIGLMMFGQRMSAATGEASYYDEVERALYNTVLAATNMEGDRYFYVNPLEVVPEFCTENTYMDHVKPVRQKWFSVACCPPNIARTLASLGQYIYAQEENTVCIHQFISSEAKAERDAGSLKLRMDSQLLQSGTVLINAEAEGEWKLKLRIPYYAEEYTVTIDGKKAPRQRRRGYLELALPAGSSEIRVFFDVRAKWMGADDRVRADAGKTALVKGPLVYCLEEIDNGALLSQIYVKENIPVTEGEAEPGLAGNVPTLCYPAVRIANEQHGTDKLYDTLKFVKKDIQVKAIPYCLWNNRGEGEMTVWQKVRI